MRTTTIRQELKKYIDEIPENNLDMAQRFLCLLSGRLIIETNLTASEKAVIKAGRKERKEHPENFTSWSSIKAAK